jgi:hypothetical protein
MRITMRRARFEVNQLASSCGFGDALQFTLVLSLTCLDFDYVIYVMN